MFKKLWKVLLVILIVVCIFMPVLAPAIGAWLTTAGYATLGAGFTAIGSALASWGALAYWFCGAVGLGLAYTIDPSTTTEIIRDTGEVVTKVVDGAIDIVGSAASTALGWLAPVLLAAGAFFILASGKDGDPNGVSGTGREVA